MHAGGQFINQVQSKWYAVSLEGICVDVGVEQCSHGRNTLVSRITSSWAYVSLSLLEEVRKRFDEFGASQARLFER